MKKILLGFTLLISNFLFSQTSLETAVDFNVKDMEGNLIQLFDLLDEDKIVVIKFYSTACTWCELYAPDIQATYEKYGCNTSNVFVMTIDRESNNTVVSGYYAMHGLTLPGVSGLDGNGGNVFELYQVPSTPTVIVINTDKTITNQYVWPPEFGNIVPIVDSLGGIEKDCEINTFDISEEKILKIVPNPAVDHFEIISEKKYDRIDIYNSLGVFIEKHSNDCQVIDVNDYVSGMYFVCLMLNNGLVESKSILVQH